MQYIKCIEMFFPTNPQAGDITVMRKEKIIAIGASTGGVDALELLFAEFPINIPPVLVVLHMPVGFTRLFAMRMDDKNMVKIKEAESGDVLKNGTVFIAPAGQHMTVTKKQGKYTLECAIGEKVHSVIPSADVLFESIANEPGLSAIGVILTGLGADGARGLLKMRESGAETIGQDKETCVIYGMPKVAFTMNAVKYQLPLGKIAEKIFSLSNLHKGGA